MSQVTIYLEDKLEKEVKESAKAEGLSVSKWIARAIQERKKSAWPPELLASFGTWGDDVPYVEEMRARDGVDTPRETFD